MIYQWINGRDSPMVNHGKSINLQGPAIDAARKCALGAWQRALAKPERALEFKR